jgi:hypothetical protein
MVAILDHQPPPPPIRRPRPNLCLHCGAQTVERNQVQLVPTPCATDTWTPIPHLELVTQVERTLKSNGLVVGTQAHSLTRDGARYFGLMEVQRDEFDVDYCWVLGLRNSHDKTFPAGITAGASVFVCDNLSFSGEVKLARKHTRFITRDLPQLVQGAVGKLMDHWNHQDTRLSIYKLTEIEDRTAHDLIVRATDVGVCPNKLVPRVLREWREPRHDAFIPRNAWSLFNAFTEALKGNLIELPRRTEALHGLLDTHVGLDAPTLN